MRTVLLLAGWAIACPVGAQAACHDDARYAAEQRALDEAQIAELLREHPVQPTPPRLQAMLDELVDTSPLLRARAPVKLLIVENQELNAFAADHGVVLLSSALQDPRHRFSDDELAAVIAHELAHIESRDGLGEACEMRQGLGDSGLDIAQVRARLATLNPASALGRRTAELLHGQELRADAWGIAGLRAAGRDPAALPSVLAKLHAPHLPGVTPASTSTHPALQERLEHATALLDDGAWSRYEH